MAFRGPDVAQNPSSGEGKTGPDARWETPASRLEESGQSLLTRHALMEAYDISQLTKCARPPGELPHDGMPLQTAPIVRQALVTNHTLRSLQVRRPVDASFC